MKRLLSLALTIALCLFSIPALAQSGVCYEVFVRSYADSDGDGIGDLCGLTEKLDYLQDLGVKSLWLMPICPSPSYHKYDVTDYEQIDSEYGSLADFDALVTAAKDRGIGLILDLVINHTSDEHPWFKAACAALKNGESSPYLDYYRFSQEKKSGWHEVLGADGWYYEGKFNKDMPDLNLESEAVRGEIEKIAAFWLERGAAGFRLDEVIHYTDSAGGNIEFLRWLKATCESLRPGSTLVGEGWTDKMEIARLYESGIDSLFNFPMSQQSGGIANAVKREAGAGYAETICAWNETIRGVSPSARDSIFLSNHDMGRGAGYFPRDERKMKSAAALYLLSPGTPYVYYGEELALTGSGRDENKRLPMLWDGADETKQCLPPKNADQQQRQTLGVKQQEADASSMLSFYKQAIALRNRCAALDSGLPTLIDTGYAAVAAFSVSDDTGLYDIYNNLGAESAVIAARGTLLGAVGALSGEPTLEGGALTLPGYGACIVIRDGGETE